MSIINDKIRHMTPPQKMKYFLTKLVDPTLSKHQKEDITLQVSVLAKDVRLDKFLDTFELQGNLDKSTSPALLTVQLSPEQSITLSLNEMDRKDFKDAHPEPEKRPIQSFLTEEELKELNTHE